MATGSNGHLCDDKRADGQACYVMKRLEPGKSRAARSAGGVWPWMVEMSRATALCLGARLGEYGRKALPDSGGLGSTYLAHDARLIPVARKDYFPASMAYWVDTTSCQSSGWECGWRRLWERG